MDIKTNASYHLKGNVKHYIKEHVVKPKRVRGSVAIDSLNHGKWIHYSMYVDIPRKQELTFNEKGFLIYDKGIRFPTNGGDWENRYEYYKTGDTLSFRKYQNDKNQEVTFDYEFMYEGENMVEEYSRETRNFKGFTDFITIRVQNIYNIKGLLVEVKEQKIEKKSNGDLDTINSGKKITYILGKRWKTERSYNGRPSYKYYYPFKGCNKFFSEVDSLFDNNNKLMSIKRLMVADNIEISEDYNIKYPSIEKCITTYDELGRVIDRTTINYNDLIETGNQAFTSTFREVYVYDTNNKNRIRSATVFDVNEETNTLGEKLLSRDSNEDGRMTTLITQSINRRFEYFKDVKGNVIKKIQTDIQANQDETSEVTTYAYDHMNNLVHEKTINSDGEVLFDIRHTITYFD
ncbi:hypothetical protein [uncultured Dokdonia sp.]|uniref:hypothetical protein n=1 Tax=uncultured Dokdonia sp. TaxID=575653 RepID=UPI00260ADC11|nr:hypothetical protein [uncultured Dokdonia sp.]